MTDALVEMKTTQEEQADLVRCYVDEYAALSLEANRIKQRMEWLKGWFEILATGALKDSLTDSVPVVRGTCFVTGVGEKEAIDEIIKILRG